MIQGLEIENLDIILDTLNNGQQIVLPAEFKLSLNSYLSDLSYSPVRSLADVIAFNNANPVEVSYNFEFRFLYFVVAFNIVLLFSSITDGKYLHVFGHGRRIWRRLGSLSSWWLRTRLALAPQRKR